ncbi:laccase, partial [Flavobacterium sp. IR1]
MGEGFSEIHPECLAVEQWQNENSDLVAGVTTRKGGLSEPPFNTLNMGFHVNDELDTVLKNRERFAEIISFPLNQWVGSEQVHGSTIQKVTKEDMGLGARTIQDAISAADGLYTKERGILLTSLYADCVPLLSFAGNHGIIGVAHAGWKGTVQLIGPKMTEKW